MMNPMHARLNTSSAAVGAESIGAAAATIWGGGTREKVAAPDNEFITSVAETNSGIGSAIPLPPRLTFSWVEN